MVGLVAIKELVVGNAKLVAGVAGVVGLGISVYQLHGYVYDSGRESMRVEMVRQYNEQLKDQQIKYELEIKNALDRITLDHKDELERVRSEQEIIVKVEKVIEYVDKEIIVKPECDILASDVVGLLQQATDLVTNSSNE